MALGYHTSQRVSVCVSVFRTIWGPVYTAQVFTPNATLCCGLAFLLRNNTVPAHLNLKTFENRFQSEISDNAISFLLCKLAERPGREPLMGLLKLLYQNVDLLQHYCDQSVFFASTPCSVVEHLMCWWTACSCGMSLLHRLLAWHVCVNARTPFLVVPVQMWPELVS